MGGEADEVCGSCHACLRVDRGLHPDARIWVSEAELVRRGLVTWEEERKPSVEIKVEQVRALREALRLTAFEGGWRVAILPQAERLRPEAGNALLKTLEEPLQRTLLILCAPDKRAILETLRSRCQVVPFAPLHTEDLAALVQERRGLSRDMAFLLAAQSHGSAATALLAEPDAAQRSADDARLWLQQLNEGPLSTLLSKAEELDSDEATQRVLALARVAVAESELMVERARADGLVRRRAEGLLRLAAEAVQLSMDLARPGANVRLSLERFMLRSKGLTTSTTNS
jgi:DNA polymerase-3 subunit delta'